jgi:thiol-disulfide isomerase/thioredoxin
MKMKKKKTTLILCFCLLPLAAIFAEDRVINNPAVDFYPGGITHVTKIVLTDTETRVHVLDKFIPGWWVKYEQSTYLVDNATGKRYQIQAIIGGELDKRMFMSSKGSGDSARVLIFPPIDKTVKKVDLVREKVIPDKESNDETSYIYGISFNPEDNPQPQTVPATVQKWLAEETGKAKRKALLDVDGGEFFVKDTARIVGYIKGYDRRAGFSAGKISYDEDVTVHEDGRFEGSVALDYPRYMPLLLGEVAIQFYVEPGQTLSMVLDWEEFRKADRKRNIKYTFTDIRFEGAAAGVNSELCGFFAKLPYYNARNLYRRLQTGISSDELAELYRSELGEYDRQFNSLLESESLQPRTKRLLQIYSNLNKNNIFTAFKSYDLLPDFPQNDILMLAFANISELASHLEFNLHIAAVKANALQQQKSLREYFYEELGPTLTAQDSLILNWATEPTKVGNKLSKEQIEEYVNMAKDFSKKYEKQLAEYNATYLKLAMEELNKNIPQLEDSIFTHVLKIKPSLLYNLIWVERYKRILDERTFTADERAEIARSFADIQPLAQSLIDESDKVEKLLASEESTKGVAVNENPAVENEKLMETIIEKYRGKVVFVDFWATWCGPCLTAMKTIQPVKEELQAKDVVFLYITGETSPLIAWKKKMAEIHGEHYRLAGEQWEFLKAEFGIKGIPAYLVYDKNGSIASEVYTGYPGNATVKSAIENGLSK